VRVEFGWGDQYVSVNSIPVNSRLDQGDHFWLSNIINKLTAVKLCIERSLVVSEG